MTQRRIFTTILGRFAVWTMIAAGAMASVSAWAVDLGEIGGVRFTGSGFLTLAAGKVLNGGGTQASSGFNCPCFVSDFAQTGVYESGRLSMQPDSKLGLQGSMIVSDSLSATGQVVQRGANGGQTDFEWLYATQKLGDHFTLQVGRKRLPLFFYSESQDVGFSTPWVHLSPQLYGWEVVNYNGVNLMYTDGLGDWSLRMNVFAGDETVKNSGYWKIYNGRNAWVNSRWSTIRGGDLSLSKDWFEARLMVMQSGIQNTTPPSLEFGARTRQRIYGLSLHTELDTWITHAEFLNIDRKESYGRDYTQLYAVGYRMGKWLPMLSYANYTQQQRTDPVANWNPANSEAHRVATLSLRYDLTGTSAVKLQYDRWMNRSTPGYFAATPNAANPTQSANLLAISYDLIF